MIWPVIAVAATTAAVAVGAFWCGRLVEAASVEAGARSALETAHATRRRNGELEGELARARLELAVEQNQRGKAEKAVAEKEKELAEVKTRAWLDREQKRSEIGNLKSQKRPAGGKAR